MCVVRAAEAEPRVRGSVSWTTIHVGRCTDTGCRTRRILKCYTRVYICSQKLSYALTRKHSLALHSSFVRFLARRSLVSLPGKVLLVGGAAGFCGRSRQLYTGRLHYAAVTFSDKAKLHREKMKNKRWNKLHRRF